MRAHELRRDRGEGVYSMRVRVIAKPSQKEFLRMNFVENFQRVDLKPSEEAAGIQQMLDLVDGSGAGAGIINIVAVDPNQHGTTINQKPRCGFRQERMVLEIWLGTPESVPTGMDQHSLPRNIQARKSVRINSKSVLKRLMGDDPVKLCQLRQIESSKVFALRKAMKRAIDVRASIRDHVDPPDLEGRAIVIMAARCLTFPIVTDDRCGQPPERDHAMFDLV